jgi:uncharacterized protein (DUF885 family)
MAGLVWGAALVQVLPVAAASKAAEPPPNRALAALFEREYRLDLQEHPESATYVGAEGLNDRLTDNSLAAVERRKQHVPQLLRELQRFDRVKLNAQDQLSLALMRSDLQQQQRSDAFFNSLPFGGLFGWNVVGPGHGPQHSYPSLAKAAPARNLRDVEDYLKRLAAMPAAMAQMTAQMRAGMRSGWLPPAAVMQRVPGQFDAFVGSDLAKNPLYAPFAQLPADWPAPERERLQAAGRRVLTAQVVPAYAAMQKFLKDDYIPACPAAIAASSLPGGAAFYAQAVREGTTTELTPRQVHDIGLAEVQRIGVEMDGVIRQAGFSGDRAAFMAAIRADKRFYFTDPQEMLKAYRDIAKRIDAELPKLFAELPRLPYGIRPMEPYEGDNAEHYTPGALDGSRAGFFEANVLSLDTRPSYDLENTLLHEAAPGHHLQISRAQELKGLPEFRRLADYNAYVEGWALYAESLGPALGLYKDPYSHFGGLRWEMLRACRLVIDTGVHAFGWQRQQAIDYLMAHTGLDRGFAESEVDRYISSPGQALGYKIGELKIKQLRAEAQRVLGERFDIRHFHNAVLDDGAMPLTVLEQRMGEWVRREGNRPAR